MTLAASLAVAAAAVAAVGPVLAQDSSERMTGKGQVQPPPAEAPASPQRKTKDLIAEGFEIKSVTVIPREIVNRGGSTLDVDAVIILLQKGTELANCYVTFAGFADGSYYNGDTPICTVLK